MKLYVRKSRELCISIKLQHDSTPDVMITNVEDGDDVVQMGDVVGMITGDVLEVDVEHLDCFLYVSSSGNPGTILIGVNSNWSVFMFIAKFLK